MRVAYARDALSDLDGIEEYHTEKVGIDFAKSLVERVTGTFERLASRKPRAGRLREELGPGVRALPVLPFIVFYFVDKKQVYVLRVLHGHRNIKLPLASLLLAM